MIGIVTKISIGTWREASVPLCGPLGAIAGVISAVAGVAGTLVSMQGAQAAAQSQKQAKEFEAAQRQQQAQESRAAAQRQALEHVRQGNIAQSSLQARAAASGAGASDETVIGLGEDLGGRSEYQRLMDIYTGENRARGYQDMATAARMEGDAALTAGKYRATGTLLSGIGSFADSAGKFGKSGRSININGRDYYG